MKSTETVYQLYQKYNARRVVVETVAFQLVLKKVFKRYHMAVQEYKTIKDKTTRLMERQIDFEDRKVLFAVNK
jgi:hypothetical protein